jgi:hypothetical protein
LPSTNYLRSDSPLYFTLSERPCGVAWKHVNRAATTSSTWVGAQLRADSRWSLLSKTAVNFASVNSCPLSMFQSLVQPWLHRDRQFAHSAEQDHSNWTSNIGPDCREMTASLWLCKSAACTVLDVQTLSTSRRHSHELVAHSPNWVGASLHGNGEVSWYELATSLLSGKSPACDVLDVDVQLNDGRVLRRLLG